MFDKMWNSINTWWRSQNFCITLKIH